jgi:hypothetical protein
MLRLAASLLFTSLAHCPTIDTGHTTAMSICLFSIQNSSKVKEHEQQQQQQQQEYLFLDPKIERPCCLQDSIAAQLWGSDLVSNGARFSQWHALYLLLSLWKQISSVACIVSSSHTLEAL